MKNIQKTIKDKDILYKSKTARGFIFIVGMFLICIAVYLYIFPVAPGRNWINVITFSIGVVLVLCAKYAKHSTVSKLEQLFTGWP